MRVIAIDGFYGVHLLPYRLLPSLGSSAREVAEVYGLIWRGLRVLIIPCKDRLPPIATTPSFGLYSTYGTCPSKTLPPLPNFLCITFFGNQKSFLKITKVSFRITGVYGSNVFWKVPKNEIIKLNFSEQNTKMLKRILFQISKVPQWRCGKNKLSNWTLFLYFLGSDQIYKVQSCSFRWCEGP